MEVSVAHGFSRKFMVEADLQVGLAQACLYVIPDTSAGSRVEKSVKLSASMRIVTG